MLEDKQRDRILLEDGTSLTNLDSIVKKILKKEVIPETVKTIRSFDTENYDLHFNRDYSFSEEIKQLSPNNHVHTEQQLDTLIELLENSDRFGWTDNEIERLQKELSFFVKTNNILFLLEVKKLIDIFAEKDIVWGIGRGSACASFVLYLLKVHDVNPIKYHIDFFELSKEQD